MFTNHKPWLLQRPFQRRDVEETMRRNIVSILAVLTVLSMASVAGAEHEQEQTRDQDSQSLFGSTLNGQPLLGQQQKDAYGLGVHSDSTGRPFSWQAEGETQPNPLLEVKPNGYGLGVGSDQFGGPVRPVCPHGMRMC
jgi:hypothetical protein